MRTDRAIDTRRKTDAPLAVDRPKATLAAESGGPLLRVKATGSHLNLQLLARRMLKVEM